VTIRLNPYTQTLQAIASFIMTLNCNNIISFFSSIAQSWPNECYWSSHWLL